MRVLTNIDYVGRGLFEPRHEERDRLCPDCDGDGHTVETCPECIGGGWVYLYEPPFPPWGECGNCEGRGTVKAKCETCDGYGATYPDYDEERD